MKCCCQMLALLLSEVNWISVILCTPKVRKYSAWQLFLYYWRTRTTGGIPPTIGKYSAWQLFLYYWRTRTTGGIHFFAASRALSFSISAVTASSLAKACCFLSLVASNSPYTDAALPDKQSNFYLFLKIDAGCSFLSWLVFRGLTRNTSSSLYFRHLVWTLGLLFCL